jgi:aminoglycoside phosphotransferase family enzyme/predicted kinase
MPLAVESGIEEDRRVEDVRSELRDWLARRDPGTPVRLAETHMSVLAFQGDRVYKVKKPVRFAFADLSTPELRRADCEREVALNRRFAPDVYLGVLPLTDAAGAVVDHAVEMVRLPDNRRLAAIVADGEPVRACLEHLARDFAAAHRVAATGGRVDNAAGSDAIAALWDAGIEQLAPYEDFVLPAGTARCVASLARRYVSGRGPVFAARVAAGRARDGHGDLLADDVFCLDEGPRAIDCLEFDDRLRFGDVLSDIAFLAMDLERLGRHDLAHMFLDEYRRAAGDEWPDSLAHMYVAYRAHVRAKVACLRHDQGDPDAAAAACSLLALAHRHLEAGRVRLVVVGGPPASGKSTLAAAIAEHTGWMLLRSDVVRKEGLRDTDARRIDAPLDTGLYEPATTRRTYDTLLARAQAALATGSSVVLDASWSDPERRLDAYRVARESASDVVALHCDAPEDVRVERASLRSTSEHDASDAGPEVAALLTARFAEWPEATTVDTTRSVEVVTASVVTDLHRDSCEAG